MSDEPSRVESPSAGAGGRNATGVSRRAFVKGLSAIGAGTIFFSSGLGNQAKAQYGSTHVDGLSAEKLTGMYNHILKQPPLRDNT